MRPAKLRIPGNGPRISPLLWMRGATLLCCGVLLALPGRAWAERSLELGTAAGVRWFSESVSLNEDLFLSLRLGIRTGSVFTLWTDISQAHPEGKYSRSKSMVSSLRALGQVDLRTGGTVRPYLLAGVGGLVFDFTDRTDAAFGTLTAGAGLGVMAGTRTRLFLEGTADFFWTDETRYDVTGRPINGTERYGESTLMASAGMSVRF